MSSKPRPAEGFDGPPDPPPLGSKERPPARPQRSLPPERTAAAESAYDGPPDPPPLGQSGPPPGHRQRDADTGRDQASRSPPSPEPASDAVAARFQRFVDHVKKKRPSLLVNLGQVRPLDFNNQVLRLGCDTDFDEQRLQRRETQEVLSRLLAAHEGHEIRIEVVRTENAKGPATINEKRDSAAAKIRAEREKRAREHPSVGKLRGLFGAEIAKVRVVDDGEPR